MLTPRKIVVKFEQPKNLADNPAAEMSADDPKRTLNLRLISDLFL
jgi:hypothetical protein